MSDDRWQQVEKLYHAALELPSDQRAAFLQEACGGDSDLAQEVESLLGQYQSKDSVFDQPAWSSLSSSGECATANKLLGAGSRLGPYEITGMLGAGGMGQVFRAHDSRLQRSVAIKVLLPEQDLRRFEREACAIASLSHPNVVPIFDVGHESGVDYLVEELVEGESLRDVLQRGPLSVARFRHLALQIAEGLAAAHRAGIIHRDLKPENIMVTRDDCARILDFGLATGHRDGSGAGTISLSKPGAVAGTPAYMSPEQIRGSSLDVRSDIFSCGALMYEMITGRCAFAGESTLATLAAVLDASPPPIEKLVAGVPPELSEVILKCLRKDPDGRYPSIDEVRIAIGEPGQQTGAAGAARRQRSQPQEVSSVETTSSPAEPSAKPGFRRWWLVLAGALVSAGAMIWHFAGPRADLRERRVEIETPATSDPRSFALSPDGRQIAYVATADGENQLWVRQLDKAQGKPLVKTEGGAAYPFWSPDGWWIAFFSGGKLRRISSNGGNPQDLADVKSGRGGAWSADGVILFTPEPQAALFRVPATGGEATVAIKLGWAGSHRFAQFLPDGNHFLFYAEGSPQRPGSGTGIGSIYLGSLDSADATRVTAADTAGLYTQGWLLWVRAGTLVARKMNPKTGELAGDVKSVAEPVFYDTSHARLFSVSASGTVAYRSGIPVTQLVWFDRTGTELGALGGPAEERGQNSDSMRISPDGRRVAVSRMTRDHTEVWLMDETRATRFTFQGAWNPIWSPDGKQIAFCVPDPVTAPSRTRIFTKPSDGSQGQTLLLDSLPRASGVYDWSPDGKTILFHERSSEGGYDLWTVRLEGDRASKRFLGTRFDEKYGRFSPDGRWIAYTSDELGRTEIYIRAFTGTPPAQWQVSTDGGLFTAWSHDGNTPPAQWQVSTDGGLFTAWSHDGKELYWVGPGGRMMAASIPGGSAEPSKPAMLFQAPIYGGGLDVNTGGAQFDVSADGRFLINMVKDARSSAITLLENWKPR
jgi:serine/threonine protein kinase/Tol biopolymer transport system component